MREFVRGSAKCMIVLIKKLRNTGEHYHVLQYAMDRYATRDRIDRWDVKGGSWEAGRCQVCWIRRGINRRQTKEHIWSGRCEGSKNIVQGLERAIQLTCDKGGNSSLFGYVWPVMKEMMTKVNTDSHTLENHECSGALVGIWPNRTFDIVRNKIMQQGGESPHTAQQLTEDLVVTHIKYSIRMMQIWNNVVKEWKTPLTEEETGAIEKLQKGETTVESIAKFNRLTMAWEGKWTTSINNLNMKSVPTCAEDIALDEAGFKKGISAMSLWENRANWSIPDMNTWKSRSRQIEGFLKRPAALAKIELYGRGQNLRKKWQDFLVLNSWEELLLEVERQATEKGGSKWGNLVAMAINVHQDGKEEGVSQYQRKKIKLGVDMDITIGKKQKLEKTVPKRGRTENTTAEDIKGKVRRIERTQQEEAQAERVDTTEQIRQMEKKGKKRQRDEQDGPGIMPPPYLPAPSSSGPRIIKPPPQPPVLSDSGLHSIPPLGRLGQPALPAG